MNLKGLIGEIKKYLELVDVMEYHGINFVSKTGDAWKAECFRHEEKIPSLTVSPRKGLFHCFSTGCEAGGDVISFYQQFHNLDVYHAAVGLAQEFGVDASPFLEQTEEDKTKARLYRITNQVAGFFHQELFKSKGALAYVKKRGVGDQTLRSFSVGYSKSVVSAVSAARKAGASMEDVKALGFMGEKHYGNAIVFPIYGAGSPATFYSKSMSGGDAEGAKYIGPHGTHPLRRPGQMFGLQVARRFARQDGLTLVEGFFDCLTLHSKGIENVVCMLGSSPTSEQMQIISDMRVPRVTVLFDADRAGEAGALKVIENRRGDVLVKIAFCPEGDPDEYALRFGASAIRGILAQAVGAGDFLLGKYIDRLMGGDLDERSKNVMAVMSLSAKLPSHESAMLLKEVSEATGISIDELKDASVVNNDKQVLESEIVVLAGCLKDESNLLEAIARFHGRDVFLNSRHRTIWEAIHKLRARKVLQFTPDLIRDSAGGLHLNGTLDSVFSRAVDNFEYHLGIVYDSYSRRALKRAAGRLASSAFDGSKPVHLVLSDHLAGLSKEVVPDSSVEFTASQQVESAMDYIHERMSSDGAIPGIDLGEDWKSFTQCSLGLQRSYLYLVSALPKIGKTTLAMNWCMAAAIEQKIPTLWLNFEMRQRDLALRFLSIMSGVSNTRLRMGSISAEEKEKVDEAGAVYYEAPLHVVDAASLTLHEVVNMMRKYVYDKGVKLIFLDYIQLIRQSDSKLQYWEHHQRVSTELKSAINSLDVPLVGISQLSKSSLEGGGSLHQGGSFKYLQDCDMAMELRRKSKAEMDEAPSSSHRLNIEFARHGVMEVGIDLFYNRESLRCQEV